MSNSASARLQGVEEDMTNVALYGRKQIPNDLQTWADNHAIELREIRLTMIDPLQQALSDTQDELAEAARTIAVWDAPAHAYNKTLARAEAADVQVERLTALQEEYAIEINRLQREVERLTLRVQQAGEMV